MVNRLNLVNIVLVFFALPVAALLVRDYLIYVHNPPEALMKKAQPAQVLEVADIRAFAEIVEKPLFPSDTRKFTPRLPADDSKGAENVQALSGIVLRGTFAGRDGFAIFEENKTGGEHVFRPGELVFGSWPLKKILKDSVVLATGSGETVLRLNENGMTVFEEHGPSAQNKPAERVSARTGEGMWVLDRKAVLNAVDNISQIISDARLTPINKDGKMNGFRISEIKENGIFHTLGLKNGDVLSRVNGFEITSPERAIQVLTALKGENRVNLDLVRDGSQINFRYEIR